jgi:hypothetical protein
MAQVKLYDRDGLRESTITVKNLGWLLRHAEHVNDIFIDPPIPAEAGACRLSAHGKMGDRPFIYATYFADLSVCRAWVKRPSLAHVRLWDLT